MLKNLQVTGPQMKAIDYYTIENIGIPSMVLMERAALHVSHCVEESAPNKKKIAVVCGHGNNGADGVAVGRILFLKGYEVIIYLAGNGLKETEEMKKQLAIARNIGIPILTTCLPNLEDYDVLIDALLGIGLSKEVTGDYLKWVQLINKGEQLVFSIDIPSGLSATSGEVLGTAIKADFTITFGLMKIGLTTRNGRNYSGEIIVGDIGYPEKAIQHVLISKV